MSGNFYSKEKRLFSVRELTKFMKRYRYQSGKRMRGDLRKLLAHNQIEALTWLTGGIVAVLAILASIGAETLLKELK